jgi:hypothetical protein
MNDSKKWFVCKRMRLCRYLAKKKGFKIEKVRPDRVNPLYNVWLFKYSEELEDAVKEYYKNIGIEI